MLELGQNLGQVRKVKGSYVYDSFGNLTSSTSSSTNSFQYTGREFDSETGLYYYRARYYDPEVGRFMNEDPIGFSGGINFFAYVANNPINFNNPFGLKRSRRKCKRTPQENLEYVSEICTSRILEAFNDIFETNLTTDDIVQDSKTHSRQNNIGYVHGRTWNIKVKLENPSENLLRALRTDKNGRLDVGEKSSLHLKNFEPKYQLENVGEVGDKLILQLHLDFLGCWWHSWGNIIKPTLTGSEKACPNFSYHAR